MGLLTIFRQGELPLRRIEFLSDGIFAVVATVLVFQLKVPELYDPGSIAELGERLLEVAPKFGSWLLTEMIVFAFWMRQHQVLAQAGHADHGLVWLNLLFLTGQAFIPFPAALWGEYPLNPLATGFYGSVMALNILLLIGLHAHIVSHHLLRPEYAHQNMQCVARCLVLVMAFVLAAASGWFSPVSAYLLYGLTALYMLYPQLYSHDPAAAPDAPREAA